MSSQKQKKFGAENRQAKKRRLLEESVKKCKSLDNFFASGISPGADDGMGVTSRLLDYPPIESQFQPCGHMPDEVASPNILCDTTSNNLIVGICDTDRTNYRRWSRIVRYPVCDYSTATDRSRNISDSPG